MIELAPGVWVVRERLAVLMVQGYGPCGEHAYTGDTAYWKALANVEGAPVAIRFGPRFDTRAACEAFVAETVARITAS